MKKCTDCKETKPLSEFDKKKGGWYSGYCKDCRRKKIKEHYVENKKYYIEKAAKNDKQYRKQYSEYKSKLSCADCGLLFSDKPYLCDFHHPNKNKERDVASVSVSKKLMEKEIAKCIPLCANCHRIRHHKSRL